MSYRLVVLVRAAHDIERAREWYAGQRTGLGDDFGRALDGVLLRLRARPLASPVWLPDRAFRRAHLPRFPYTVFFRIVVDDEVIEVVAVAHQRQRPGRWLGLR